MTQENQELTPKELAEQFMEAASMLKKPTTAEEDTMSSDILTVRIFDAETSRAVPEDFGQRIMGKLSRILAAAPITDRYRTHIQDEIRKYVESPMLRSLVDLDNYSLLTGIDLENESYGVFDPETAKDAEKEAFRVHYQVTNARLFGRKAEDLIALDAWENEFMVKYQENPHS